MNFETFTIDGNPGQELRDIIVYPEPMNGYDGAILWSTIGNQGEKTKGHVYILSAFLKQHPEIKKGITVKDRVNTLDTRRQMALYGYASLEFFLEDQFLSTLPELLSHHIAQGLLLHQNTIMRCCGSIEQYDSTSNHFIDLSLEDMNDFIMYIKKTCINDTEKGSKTH